MPIKDTWSVMAFSGYMRGNEYKEWLNQEETKRQKIERSQINLMPYTARAGQMWPIEIQQDYNVF